MVNRVTDFKIRDGVIFAVIDILVNDKWINSIDYIKVYNNDIKLIINDNENKQRFLNLINKIYINHIKNHLLNKGYPIFKVERYLTRRLEVTLIDFKLTTGTEVNTLVVPDFVNNVIIDKMYSPTAKFSKLAVRNIVLSNNIVLGEIVTDDIIRLDNLENVKYFMSKAYKTVCESVKHFQNGVLTLKNVTSFPSINDKVYTGITKIIFEDTSKIKNLTPSIITNNLNLAEIRLCKSLETLDNDDINNYIITDDNGNKLLSYYGSSIKIIN